LQKLHLPLRTYFVKDSGMSLPVSLGRFGRTSIKCMIFMTGLGWSFPAIAAPDAFTQALAASVSENGALTDYYRGHGFEDLWTGADDKARRAQLFAALDQASLHGLPVVRYDADDLRLAFNAAQTEGDRGRLEAAMSLAYLQYATDLSSGATEPGEIDSTIKRLPQRPDPAMLLVKAGSENFAQFLADLPPDHAEYALLIKEKIMLERAMASGGFGPTIAVAKLELGSSGAAVVALRDRLQAFGYLGASASRDYDHRIAVAVQRFQADYGLPVDGVAGESTIRALNEEPLERLQSVIVALERLRWFGDTDFGDRYIWVNIPSFMAQIVDEGRITFDTRVVVGKDGSDTRTPEFSETMKYLVVNPSWSVPRSITTKEYLPMLRSNPNAVGHLQVIDSKGRVVPRGSVNFAAYSAKNFPYALRQAPSDGNALGKVKFMFPNVNNIYLHDTPSKGLFANEVRAYSHGCIRVGSPFDLAYALLSLQTDDPQGLFKSYLNTGRETRVDLDVPVPVHLVYFTAWPNSKGAVTYRRDVYGRDAKIFDSLVAAGLAPLGVQG
jgi:murein L,D-transpeptidase YcbB/YkuD